MVGFWGGGGGDLQVFLFKIVLALPTGWVFSCKEKCQLVHKSETGMDIVLPGRSLASGKMENK